MVTPEETVKNLFVQFRNENYLSSLKSGEIRDIYQFFYDNSIANPTFLKLVYDVLIHNLNSGFRTVNEKSQLATILQYPRRHFKDCNLEDPFTSYGISDIEKETLSVPGKLRFKTDSK